MTAPQIVAALDPTHARLARADVRLAPLLLTTLPPPAPRQPMLPLREPAPSEVGEGDRPEVEALARQLIAALVEVIAGHRPPQQLRAWVSGEVYEQADELFGTGGGAGAKVHSIRLQTPEPRVIEASVHLHQAGRSRAAAVQLAYLDHRWQLTTLELAASPPAWLRTARGRP